MIDTSLVDWSRAQFALTAIYHWFFVPLTLGLTFIIAIMETIWYRTKKDIWKEITKFWMKLFAINFAIGVATGIILEFEFGANWSDYSWFVGDIFGTPLAIEGIMAFFLEATFVVVMLFGWNKVSPKFHLTATWLVFIGSNLSALWILVANAWMQFPTGMVFNPDTARNEMVDFWAVLFSPVAITKFTHTVISGYVIASLFVLGISSWFILKKRNTELALKSIKLVAVFGLLSALFLASSGDESGYLVSQKQPVKLAAMEAMYKGKTGPGLVLLGMPNPAKKVGDNQDDFLFKIEMPQFLSIMANHKTNTFVPGMDDLILGNENEVIPSAKEKIEKGRLAVKALADYKTAKKSGDVEAINKAYYSFEEYSHLMGYGFLDNAEEVIPNVLLIFYSFRFMVYLGMYFILLFIVVLFLAYKKPKSKIPIPNSQFLIPNSLLWLCVWTIPLGYLASELGWIVAEVGRQPWAIQDILPVKVATSHISSSAVKATFILFAALFTILLIAEIKIMLTQIKSHKI